MAGSIFDEASKKPKSPSEDKAGDKNVPKKSKKTPPALDPDSESFKMLKRVRALRLDLENQLADVREVGRINNVDIERYFGEAYELTKQEIEGLQQQEASLLAKIEAITPPESCIKKNPISKEKLTKDRKNKFRGTRQKWIPIK